jgi:tetratricopeptide (TPR) repeat protein
LGQGTHETEAECQELLAVAERLGSPADVLQTQSLLVQALARMGRTDDAVRIAEESMRMAEAGGHETLAGEVSLRLAITLLAVRPQEATDRLLRVVARARTMRDRVLEARALLSLGVARTRTRDDRAGAEAFRAALKIARDAQALDVAASASMNLGVLELRRGDFAAAHHACKDALRLYTTLRNNANRLAALYNLAHIERERGDVVAALAIYRETAALAAQVGAAEIVVGAHAGAGLTALRLNQREAAHGSLLAAEAMLAARIDWWFQGRELLESLIVRLAVQGGEHTRAAERFHRAVERLEPMDLYSAAWMVADCGAELAPHDTRVWDVITRFSAHHAVREFVPLSARFTALRDLAERPMGGRSGSAWSSTGRAESTSAPI